MRYNPSRKFIENESVLGHIEWNGVSEGFKQTVANRKHPRPPTFQNNCSTPFKESQLFHDVTVRSSRRQNALRNGDERL